MKPFGTSMTTKLTMRAAIALVVASAAATWCLAYSICGYFLDRSAYSRLGG